METFLTERQLMETLGVSYSTVRRWRGSGFGPQFLKLGKLIRYPAAGVERWLCAQEKSAATTATENSGGADGQ